MARFKFVAGPNEGQVYQGDLVAAKKLALARAKRARITVEVHEVDGDKASLYGTAVYDKHQADSYWKEAE